MTDVPSRKPVELRLERGVLCSGRIEVVPDLEGDAHAWLSIEDASRVDQGGSDFGWVQIEGSNRDFAIVGVPPGRYRARLFTNRGVNATNEFELGPNGDDHLVLKFTTQ
jgi:hypothetical protein